MAGFWDTVKRGAQAYKEDIQNLSSKSGVQAITNGAKGFRDDFQRTKNTLDTKVNGDWIINVKETSDKGVLIQTLDDGKYSMLKEDMGFTYGAMIIKAKDPQSEKDIYKISRIGENIIEGLIIPNSKSESRNGKLTFHNCESSIQMDIQFNVSEDGKPIILSEQYKSMKRDKANSNEYVEYELQLYYCTDPMNDFRKISEANHNFGGIINNNPVKRMLITRHDGNRTEQDSMIIVYDSNGKIVAMETSSDEGMENTDWRGYINEDMVEQLRRG